MRLRAAPERPTFRLRWLLDPRPRDIEWLDDEEWLPPGDRALYQWAKQGLRAVFHDAGSGSTVLLPAYVPGGVIWAALDAGLDVRYYPVAEDLTLPVSAVADRIRSVDPEIVQFVHYFGTVDAAFDDLVSVARERNATVIEDCARGLFSRDRTGRLLGSVGDVALFCPHKTLPSPEGGILVSRKGGLPDPGSPSGTWSRTARYVVRSVLARSPVDIAEQSPAASRTQSGDVTAESRIDQAGYGLESVTPDRRCSAPGFASRRALARCRPERVRAARQARYRALRELVAEADGIRLLSDELHEGACPFGVVALADSATVRERIFRGLRNSGLPCEVLTWPPVYRDEAVRSFEGAETLRRRLLVIPTHQQLPPETIGEIAAAVTSQ